MKIVDADRPRRRLRTKKQMARFVGSCARPASRKRRGGHGAAGGAG